MTHIEWTHRPGTKGESWNPIVGCSIVSPGCTNCYAMRMAARIEAMNRGLDDNGYAIRPDPATGVHHYDGLTKRVNGNAVWTGRVAIAPEHILHAPLHAKSPRTYFVNSMGDLFHEDVPDDWIDQVFSVMALASRHTFIVLTKRSARMCEWVTNLHKAWTTMNARFSASSEEIADIEQAQRFARAKGERDNDLIMEFPHCAGAFGHPMVDHRDWPLPNVWLGVSAERQLEWDLRVPQLVSTPAAVKLVSCEPLLGHIDCGSELYGYGAVGWVIAGGESGPGARPMHPDWARSLRDQCTTAGVPFFFKQWGEFREFDQRAELTEVDNGSDDADAIVAAAHNPSWVTRDGRHIRNRNRLPIDTPCRLVERLGKGRAGRLLDGREHSEWPEVSQ